MDQKLGPDEAATRRSITDDEDDTEGQKVQRRAIPDDRSVGADGAVRRVIVTDDEDDTEGQKVQRRAIPDAEDDSPGPDSGWKRP